MEVELSLPMIGDGEDKSSPFMNRIRKNYKHVRKWAKRSATNCFRIYDKELPNYPLAIDYYDGRYCVQYFSRQRDNPEPPKHIIDATEGALSTLFGATKDAIFWRSRIKRERFQQYEKADATNDFFTVLEYGVKFRINLRDYLDTGLFLDHRETRKLVAGACKDKRVLNLFAYTCSFSVHAAIAGASFTKSVDMSNTYTEWGRENFILNSIPLKNNEIVREDCLKFLDAEIHSGIKYNVIIIDPPTISRSKKMTQMFDVQLDYMTLIQKGLRLLMKDGVIYFSTNSRKFSFDETLFPGCLIKEISYKTLPVDFHDPKIHRCWMIQKSLST